MSEAPLHRSRRDLRHTDCSPKSQKLPSLGFYLIWLQINLYLPKNIFNMKYGISKDQPTKVIDQDETLLANAANL